MNNVTPSKTRFLVLATVLFVALSGCRTYGGYGSEEASFNEIQEINERFASDLGKAKNELSTLQQAAAQNRELSAYVDRYEALLARHEALVAQHQELTGSLEVRTGALGRLSTSYRDLSRALGSITVEQLGMKKHYQQLANDLAMHGSGDASALGPMSRYQAIPPYYERLRVAMNQHSLNDALAMQN